MFLYQLQFLLNFHFKYCLFDLYVEVLSPDTVVLQLFKNVIVEEPDIVSLKLPEIVIVRLPL